MPSTHVVSPNTCSVVANEYLPVFSTDTDKSPVRTVFSVTYDLFNIKVPILSTPSLYFIVVFNGIPYEDLLIGLAFFEYGDVSSLMSR